MLEENLLNHTAEMAVIGSCISLPEAVDYAFHNIDQDHFLDPKNKSLFKVILRIHKKGMKVDLVSIQENLTKYEKSTITIKHILELVEKVPSALNFRHYAQLMRNRYFLAELDKRYEKIKIDPFDEETKKDISKLWDMLTNHGTTVSDFKTMTMKYIDTLENRKAGKEFKIKTGFTKLDNLLGGLVSGNIIAVGARTTLGKTSLLLNFALNFMKSGLRVLFISAEMVGEELLDRMMAMASDISISKLRGGLLSKEDFSNIMEKASKFYTYPMWCLEGGRMSMSRIRQAIGATNPSIVFVDFIQRFTPPNANMNRAAYFSDLANEFKALAMDKKIVIFIASQLSRDIEKNNDGKGRMPQLSDFKESGGIEEAADIAMLLQAFKTGETKEQRRIIVHVCKHRNGPQGKIPFIFKKMRTMFFEEEEDLSSPKKIVHDYTETEVEDDNDGIR